MEASYTVRERGTVLAGGHLLVVADPRAAVRGLDALVAAATPGGVTAVVDDGAQAAAVEAAIDRIGEDHHALSGLAKDLGSAAVFGGFVLLGLNWLLVLCY